MPRERFDQALVLSQQVTEKLQEAVTVLGRRRSVITGDRKMKPSKSLESVRLPPRQHSLRPADSVHAERGKPRLLQAAKTRFHPPESSHDPCDEGLLTVPAKPCRRAAQAVQFGAQVGTESPDEDRLPAKALERMTVGERPRHPLSMRRQPCQHHVVAEAGRNGQRFLERR